MKLSILLAFSLVEVLVSGHPGHDVRKEAEELSKALGDGKRDMSNCAAALKAQGHELRTIQRRAEFLRAERERRGLPTDPAFIKARSVVTLEDRDAPTVLNTSHLSHVSHTPHDALDTIFASNKSCILVPEAIEGPYYVSGEFIRSDIREKQQGIPLYLDIQVIDVHTCKPVPNTMIDLWHANSTGVYSGVVSAGNGVQTDDSNINSTHGRGLQLTNKDGVAQFVTFYPGHYTGRSQHIHVATHVNGTILPNNTFSGSSISHIGQIYLDQSLSDQVELTSPYTANKQVITTNAQDFLFAAAANTSDPIAEYSFLSTSLSDGIFAWISLGIDTSKNGTIMAAATYGKDGGKANPNGFMPPPGNFTGFPPGFTLPPGVTIPGFPSATATATGTSKTAVSTGSGITSKV